MEVRIRKAGSNCHTISSELPCSYRACEPTAIAASPAAGPQTRLLPRTPVRKLDLVKSALGRCLRTALMGEMLERFLHYRTPKPQPSTASFLTSAAAT